MGSASLLAPMNGRSLDVSGAHVEYASAGPDATATGAVSIVEERTDALLVALVDGLGEGPAVAEAVRTASQCLRSGAGVALDDLMADCHERLAQTRGATATVVRLSFAKARLSWLGVGDVQAAIADADPRASRPRTRLPATEGILGHRRPELRVLRRPLPPVGALVLASHGLSATYTVDLDPTAAVPHLAERLLARHGPGSERATVLAIRWWPN